MRPEGVELAEVYATGRRVDAELVRSMLESHGLKARVWAAGMGPRSTGWLAVPRKFEPRGAETYIVRRSTDGWRNQYGE